MPSSQIDIQKRKTLLSQEAENFFARFKTWQNWFGPLTQTPHMEMLILTFYMTWLCLTINDDCSLLQLKVLDQTPDRESRNL